MTRTTLSKIEAGKLELTSQTVQLAPLINEVIETERQLAEQNKNSLAVEAQENLGTITLDPMRLRQILLNLLSNACKFTEQGEVKLRARRVRDGRDWIEMAVADTGIGGRPAGEAVRGIQPGRSHDGAALRRHWSRLGDRAQARAHDGWRRNSGKRTGQGIGVYGAPT